MVQGGARLHINCLELLPAFLSFKCFFRSKKSIHVMDNTSAIAYINQDSVPNFKQPEQGILAVVHGEGHLRSSTAPIGNPELHSRMPTDLPDYQQHTGTSGSRPGCVETVDSTLNYVSWSPDLEAFATDAFTLDWTTMRPHKLHSLLSITARMQV